jgi:hypothetical protein
VNFEIVAQGRFPCKADGTALELTLEDFVFDQSFADLPDTDMRIFHLPDLAVLERLKGDLLLLRRVLHWPSLAEWKCEREEYFVQSSTKKRPRPNPQVNSRFPEAWSRGFRSLESARKGDDPYTHYEDNEKEFAAPKSRTVRHGR